MMIPEYADHHEPCLPVWGFSYDTDVRAYGATPSSRLEDEVPTFRTATLGIECLEYTPD